MIFSSGTNGPILGLGKDYWKFWTSQVISELGSRFTQFALPLIVFKLTGSALNLAISTVLSFLPSVALGLVFGTWADRVDRKRLMVLVAIAQALVILTIPFLAVLGSLTILWVYGAILLNSMLIALSQPAEFASVPSLVTRENLVKANGYLETGYSVARVSGPLLAGALVTIMPIYTVLAFDGLSFIVAASILSLVSTDLAPSAKDEESTTSMREEISEGLRYVFGHPVLRNIILMIALTNFFEITIDAQLVFFAKEHLDATDAQVSFLYAAGGGGVAVVAAFSDALRQRISFSKATVGSLMLYGLLTVLLASVSQLWLALPIWALMMGLGILFDISSTSLQQMVAPDHILGRVRSVAIVLAFATVPLGALLGGYLIERTSVTLIFGLNGLLIFLIALSFAFTALGRAEHYLDKESD